MQKRAKAVVPASLNCSSNRVSKAGLFDGGDPVLVEVGHRVQAVRRSQGFDPSGAGTEDLAHQVNTFQIHHLAAPFDLRCHPKCLIHCRAFECRQVGCDNGRSGPRRGAANVRADLSPPTNTEGGHRQR